MSVANWGLERIGRERGSKSPGGGGRTGERWGGGD